MDGKREAAEALRRADGGQDLAPRRTTAGELRVFTWKVMIVAGVVAVVYVIGQVAQPLLLVFAGTLFAILLRRTAAGLQRLTHLPQAIGVVLLLVVLFAAAAGGGWFMGSLGVREASQLSTQIGHAIEQLPRDLRDQLSEQGGIGAWLGRLRSVAPDVVYVMGDLLVVLFVAIYLAVSPRVYRRGIVVLLPRTARPRAHEVLNVLGDSLWKWLIGQLCQMALIGLVTTGGLLLLGVPAAPALGAVAALLEFIPFIGPILAAAPAVLIAFAQDPTLALWVVGLYTLIQQAEGHIVLPLIQREMVDIPPALTIAAIAIGGVLFGILGMFLATPLAVTALVLVNLLYLEDRLGEPRHFPD